MKQLLEDCQRRLKTINAELTRLVDEAKDTATITRLIVKRGDYRTFIAELERLVPPSKVDLKEMERQRIAYEQAEAERERKYQETKDDFNRRLLAGEFEPKEEKTPEGF